MGLSSIFNSVGGIIRDLAVCSALHALYGGIPGLHAVFDTIGSNVVSFLNLEGPAKSLGQGLANWVGADLSSGHAGHGHGFGDALIPSGDSDSIIESGLSAMIPN